MARMIRRSINCQNIVIMTNRIPIHMMLQMSCSSLTAFHCLTTVRLKLLANGDDDDDDDDDDDEVEDDSGNIVVEDDAPESSRRRRRRRSDE